MLATATLQHNLAAVQAQLQTLQLANGALTRAVCLKENYIQLKDQQFRVMQRRLEELEAAVALWQDRCLQSLTAAAASSPSPLELPQAAERGDWTPWAYKSSAGGGASRAKAAAQKAAPRLEKLAQSDRNKLQPLLAALEQAQPAALESGELVFADVSEELSKILLLSLLPALLDGEGGQQLQCFSRMYRKQTMDFRVCRRQSVAPDAAVAVAGGAEGVESSAMEAPDAPSTSVASLVVSEESESSSILGASEPSVTSAEEEEMETPHLFNCVDCERRGAARVPVPHGPRELHAVKAMYVSRPLSGSAAARAAIPPLEKLGDRPLEGKPEKTPRRYSLTPKRSGPTFAVEATRTHTMTLGALPSPSQSPSALGALPLGSDGEVMPQPPPLPREKDGKIKKIVGSVFDRLSRHKPPPASSSGSSSHASPLPLGSGGAGGSSEGAGDEDESMCDGCGRGPLVGVKWVCRTCRLLAGEEYELCDKCYGQGLHGKEQEDALFARVEAIVVRKCPRLAGETELLRLLRGGICKANLKKFSFCLTWIADLLQCVRTTDLRARALEIAHIPPPVRSEFARLLRELLTRYRPDIELTTEWEPAAGTQHGVHGAVAMRGAAAPDEVQLDTLRIWVKDAGGTGSPSRG